MVLPPRNMEPLLGRRHVLMNHAKPAVLGKRDSHLVFGDAIHRRAYDGDVKRDVPREAGMEVDVLRQNARMICPQTDIFVRERFSSRAYLPEESIQRGVFHKPPVYGGTTSPATLALLDDRVVERFRELCQIAAAVRGYEEHVLDADASSRIRLPLLLIIETGLHRDHVPGL